MNNQRSQTRRLINSVCPTFITVQIMFCLFSVSNHVSNGSASILSSSNVEWLVMIWRSVPLTIKHHSRYNMNDMPLNVLVLVFQWTQLAEMEYLTTLIFHLAKTQCMPQRHQILVILVFLCYHCKYFLTSYKLTRHWLYQSIVPVIVVCSHGRSTIHTKGIDAIFTIHVFESQSELFHYLVAEKHKGVYRMCSDNL
jgi:hypothetical protein